MPLRSLLATALLFLVSASFGSDEPGKAKHVVVVVWDGMRPDFVTERYAPTLTALAHAGVVFKNNHPAYPSSTNVNGAVLATGNEPGRNGIIGNQEFRAEIDAHRPFDTADFPALNTGDNQISAHYLSSPTIAEIVQQRRLLVRRSPAQNRSHNSSIAPATRNGRRAKESSRRLPREDSARRRAEPAI